MSELTVPQLSVSRAADEFSPCVDYVVRLFARNSGFRLSFQQADDPWASHSSSGQTLRLHYGDPGTPAGPADPVPSTASTPPRLLIRRSPFFGPSYLSSPDLPEPVADLLAAAQPGGLRRVLSVQPDGTRLLSLDILAASFWFLSRYEEAIISTTDEHGRFQCSMSMAPAEMYDIPVVNRWFEQLREILLEPLNQSSAFTTEPLLPRQTIVLTHDVDLLRKYRGFRTVRHALSTAVHSGVGEATAEMRYASLVMAGIRRDPYDSFDELFTLKERIGAPSTFFLMGGGNHALDADYRLSDPAIRSLISRIRATGDEIGVHPSYESSRSQEMIASELAAVSSAAGRRVQGSRQHYLRLNVPGTLRMLAQAGLRYDSSLGFADRAGFRCGWSGCFYPFDVERREEIPIIEIPLIVMDMTLAIYERIPSELSLERLAHLLDATEVRSGAYVFLWHNVMRDRRAYPGYWDTFEYFFFACAGNARYTTLGALCDEFEQQGAALGIQ